MTSTSIIKIKVPKQELAFIDKIIKAYEGLAMVTVIGTEGEIGLLRLEVTSGTKEDILKIIKDLQKKVNLEIVKK
ncbi:hypothetical protein Halha_2056 [Halobacteroides halobius DSM 5150]|uniref:DUF4911 domain-containing protein n=1 Tax=Halobacteroides halobius (strain ATCC 35273 / DSM 5150 / MD-1) TaxID=748449 RepID=L0KBN1_HALHC|nr:DUF4911 domain-containing protein [Halobacteroides halobius]AGB41950.1 hypothetical protein Halha_2056 [Halobacteroides halobius DSM 5150]